MCVCTGGSLCVSLLACLACASSLFQAITSFSFLTIKSWWRQNVLSDVNCVYIKFHVNGYAHAETFSFPLKLSSGSVLLEMTVTFQETVILSAASMFCVKCANSICICLLEHWPLLPHLCYVVQDHSVLLACANWMLTAPLKLLFPLCGNTDCNTEQVWKFGLFFFLDSIVLEIETLSDFYMGHEDAPKMFLSDLILYAKLLFRVLDWIFCHTWICPLSTHFLGREW